MKNIIIALIILAVVSMTTYSLVFNNPTAPAPETSAVENEGEINVDIKNYAFDPVALTIKPGTKVTWTNRDTAPHTVTSDQGSLLDSPLLSQGESFSYVFTESGDMNYHCTPHPSMKGSVRIEE